MNRLPDGVTLYGKTPEFSEASIPENLRHAHRTNARTWAKIVILEGKLRYRVLEPGIRETVLSSEWPGIVEPEISHAVEAVGKVRFFVEFYH